MPLCMQFRANVLFRSTTPLMPLPPTYMLAKAADLHLTCSGELYHSETWPSETSCTRKIKETGGYHGREVGGYKCWPSTQHAGDFAGSCDIPGMHLAEGAPQPPSRHITVRPPRQPRHATSRSTVSLRLCLRQHLRVSPTARPAGKPTACHVARSIGKSRGNARGKYCDNTRGKSHGKCRGKYHDKSHAPIGNRVRGGSPAAPAKS